MPGGAVDVGAPAVFVVVGATVVVCVPVTCGFCGLATTGARPWPGGMACDCGITSQSTWPVSGSTQPSLGQRRKRGCRASRSCCMLTGYVLFLRRNSSQAFAYCCMMKIVCCSRSLCRTIDHCLGTV